MQKQTAISAQELAFEYIRRDEDSNVTGIVRAIDGITIDIERGTFVAVLGHNGSGKSTLARHLNALLTPTEGTLIVEGMDTQDREKTLKLRQCVGMVFQNPDNQIIGTLVEEDVAFGLENLGVETAEIWNRVAYSLKKVGMENFRYSSPNHLSGGQKQKVAIAGIMAMKPRCIVLDEATSMLDPASRTEVLEAVSQLHKEEGITVIVITHYMEEALYANQVLVMDRGKIAMAGTPLEIFSQEEKLRKLHLLPPPVMEIACLLRQTGVLDNSAGILTEEDLIQALKAAQRLTPEKYRSAQSRARQLFGGREEPGENGVEILESEQELGKSKTKTLENREGNEEINRMDRRPLLVLDQVSYSYDSDNRKAKSKKSKWKKQEIETAQKQYAVKGVSMSIHSGEFLALIGHTGSGKSTLLQLMNGLLPPSEGTIYFHGEDISDKKFSMRVLRCKVGLVFQYPEYQLFEETVVKDVMFGPQNQGLPLLQAQLNTFEALKLCGIGEEFLDVSPFTLSGGQKRRVAIAGVLAMKPELMILDEPAAGLDPEGRTELFGMLRSIHQKTGMSVLIVSHSMEDAAELADRIFVMKEGQLLLTGTPGEVFSQAELLSEAGLAVPVVTSLASRLCREEILLKDSLLNGAIYTKRQAVMEIIKGMEGRAYDP